jgi:hypothetical protein
VTVAPVRHTASHAQVAHRPPLHRVRRRLASLVGAVRRVRRLEHPRGRGGGVAAGRCRGPVGAGRPPCAPPRGRSAGVVAPADGHRRVGQGAGRRAGRRLGHPARRRARHREVDASPASGVVVGPSRRTQPRRVGPGVQAAGPWPGRPAGHPRAVGVVGVGDVPAGHPGGGGRGRARRARRRLGADHPRPGARAGAGLRGAGSRMCAPARARVQGARHRHRARRPRHQGRHAGGSTGARARGRHRAVVRGRSPPRPPPASGDEAPVRAHRRAGPLRDGRCGVGRGARSQRPLPRRPLCRT